MDTFDNSEPLESMDVIQELLKFMLSNFGGVTIYLVRCTKSAVEEV